MGNIIPAAAAILLRQSAIRDEPEVLLLQRNKTLKVHGGSWVFPGGKFDTQDYASLNYTCEHTDTNNFPLLDEEERLRVARRAAIRETLEEAGVRLKEESLHYYSRWLTPKSLAKRFDTYFFRTEVAAENISVDGNEICDYLWVTPSKGLSLHNEGKLVLPPPTFVTLCCLNRASHINSVGASPYIETTYYRPKLIAIDDGFCSLYEDDSGYQSEDFFTQGKRHRLLMRSGNFEYIKET